MDLDGSSDPTIAKAVDFSAFDSAVTAQALEEAMTHAESLYAHSRFAAVGGGDDRVRLCVAEVARSASSGDRAAAGPHRRVLLIHGNPSHMDHWAHTVPTLRRRAAVLAYDQPGLGKSDDFADAKQSLERSVDIALAVLDDSGWTEPVDVIGQSHGGLVAIGLSARAPERVRSIVLLGTGGTPAHPMYRFFRLPGLDRVLLALGQALSWAAGRDGEVDGRRSRVRAGVDASEGARAPGRRGWLERVLAWAIRTGAVSGFSPDPVPSSVVAEGLHASPMTLRTMVRLAHDNPCDKVAAYARRVVSPVLFIHGRDDGLVDVSYARRLFDVMREAGRKARFVELDGGHMLHFSRPLTVNPLLEDWLAP